MSSNFDVTKKQVRKTEVFTIRNELASFQFKPKIRSGGIGRMFHETGALNQNCSFCIMI